MKTPVLLIALTLTASNAWALDRHLGDVEEYKDSPLVDHSPAEKVHAPQMGEGDEYGSQLIHQPHDHMHGESARQHGEGEMYGSAFINGKKN